MWSDWLIATTEGASLADASPVTDDLGLPYIPGRSLRGLLRAAAGHLSPDSRKQDEVFGTRHRPGSTGTTSGQGACAISDAVVTRDVAEAVAGGLPTSSLFHTRSQTAIGKGGSAMKGSLRTIDVAIPGITLIAEVSGTEQALATIGRAAALVRHLGHGRSRGLGRCEMRLVTQSETAGATS